MNWLLTLLFRHIILVLILVFCLGVGIALSSMSRLSSNLIASQAFQNATLSALAMNKARTLYNSEVVNRAQIVEGITVTHDYKTRSGAIPNPATYTIELGSSISTNHASTIRLYSDYPFPNRQEEGGMKDQFQREALAYLKTDPAGQFFRQETMQGRPVFRYAEAIVMEPSCIGCHNNHPDSPKKDWQVGDVRGVLEITQPVDEFISQTRSSLKEAFAMLGGLSILGLSGLTLAIGKLRRTAKELEFRVRERTADLALANEDLEKRNELIGQVFGRYLNSEVVAELLEKPEDVKIGGDRKTLTILTSDLRGFTALSEKLSPEEVVRILNLYLKYMSETIEKYRGTIDKFMGDGILVLFGAPTIRPDDTERAVACAVAMQLAIIEVNEQIIQWGHPPLQMGIGINTGDVVVGNIGSEMRVDYSAVGNQVNLAYRIESYTVGGQILISESTWEKVRDISRIDGEKQVKPKGLDRPITIYQVSGIGGNYNLFLQQDNEVFVNLSSPISLKYTILEGKHIGADVFNGSLVQLSNRGAFVIFRQKRKDNIPPELSNVKLNLFDGATRKYSDDIYAKVMSTDTENKSFYIYVTAQSPEVAAKLDALYQSSFAADR